MRKFLFNTSVLSAVFGVIGIARTTASGPRDWRLVLMWIGWATNVAIAVGTVIEDSRADELEEY
ncbi:MAG: hypothetical protein J0G30_00330 [Actinomycetales bacterium]|nr:hypothetical protein [Actinomycetales bacterium]